MYEMGIGTRDLVNEKIFPLPPNPSIDIDITAPLHDDIGSIVLEEETLEHTIQLHLQRVCYSKALLWYK